MTFLCQMFLRSVLPTWFLICFACVSVSAASTPLVTGNGYGFGVYSLDDQAITRFYAHPYKFTKPNTSDPLAEGVETSNLIQTMKWERPDRQSETRSTASYLDQSHLISVEDEGGGQRFFMPFGLNLNVLIAIYNPKTVHSVPRLNILWSQPPASKSSESHSAASSSSFSFANVEESVIAVPLMSAADDGAPAEISTASDTKGTHTIFEGASGWAFICVDKKTDIEAAVRKVRDWQAGLTCSSLVSRELKQLEQWRVKPSVKFRSVGEKKLWRQSETVLRMAQIREPNNDTRFNHGLILASLPDGAWFVPWVRDMAYATDALIKMGHQREAKMALNAYLNARPTGKMSAQVRDFPYQISVVRYFGDGSEEPFFTGEGATNIEFDNWGLALWLIGEYANRYQDKAWINGSTYHGTVYENAKNFIVKPLLGNLDQFKDGLIVAKDTSIWEERQPDAKHFAYSSAAAIKGLESFEKVAQMKGDFELHAQLREKVESLRKGFDSAFISQGRLKGTLEETTKNDVDGAALAAITFGVVSDKAVIRSTVESMEKLKMPSGGYRRVTSIVEDPKIYEYWYERQEFLFINFLLAEIDYQLGNKERADAMLQRMVEKSSRDNWFVPEMYVSHKNYRFTGEVGEPTGAVPMVGYGAGLYISSLISRETHKSAQ